MPPVVLRKQGFTFLMWFPPKEHGPAYVHVEKGGARASIWLADAAVRSAGTMRAADLGRAQAIVASRREWLMGIWRRFHEKD
jgi:uncharacterized protein DUF4160